VSSLQAEKREKFAEFLRGYVKKNGRRLGQRTIFGVLTLARLIPDVGPGLASQELKLRLQDFVNSRNYPMAKYSLWLYLKFLGYDKPEDMGVKFGRQVGTALTDEEKLAHSVLSKQEIIRLANEIPKERNKLVVRLLYDTAARISELIGVKLSDVDFQNNEITIMGKGRKPRQVFFHPETRKMLEEWVRKNRLKPDDMVFQIKPITIWYGLKQYGKVFGKDLRPHMFRHSRLQHMADDGVDAFSIKAYAGHEDVRTTQIYVKASRFQRKLAFEKGGNIWKRG